MAEPACIWVLAGTNGSGKSSVGGALLRESGGDYFNPDEAARKIRAGDATLTQPQANARAWALGLRQLDRSMRQGRDYFFETTLGGNTITERLQRALQLGRTVRIWYVGLSSPALNVQRVAARVEKGGHDIPEEVIRRRYDSSRRNLIALLPRLAELKVYDNSFDADPALGKPPKPKLLLHCRDNEILAPADLRHTPEWTKAIVAQALKHAAH